MKKKVLIVEMIGNNGHKDINNVMLNILKTKYDVTFLAKKNFIEDIESISIKEIKENCTIDYYKNKRNKLNNRIILFKALTYIFNDIKKNNYDYIIFMGYEIISFWLTSIINKKTIEKNRIFLLNHTNIDEINNSKIKKLMFKYINGKINYLCYEDFITNYIKNNFNKQAYTLRHNLNNYKLDMILNIKDSNEFFKKDDNIKFNILCPSNNGISEKLISRLIDLDKEGYFKEINLIIKSNKIEYRGKNIQIINRYLTESKYTELMYKSDYILLPYNNTHWKYEYRVSGVFFDCITFSKPMIYYNTKFFEYVSNKYGNYGFSFENDEELIEILINKIFYKDNKFIEAISKIKQHYSDKNILQNMVEIFESSDNFELYR